MEEIKVSEMLQADSINKDDSVMIIQEGVNKKASGSIQTATGTSLSLTSVADTCKVKSNSVNLIDESKYLVGYLMDTSGVLVSNSNWSMNSEKIYQTSEMTISAKRLSGVTNNSQVLIAQFDSSNALVKRDSYTFTTETYSLTFTPESTTSYIYIGYRHETTKDVQLELGSTPTTYNPYNTEIIIADGDVSSPIIEAGTIQQANGQNATGSRMRSAGYIDVEPNKEYTLNADGNTAVVFEYKSDDTYIHRIPDNWIETPYTFTTTSETAKVRFVTESPNVTQNQIAFQEGSQSQKITLTPQEEKLAYTYNTKTGILSDGSVTIEYNTQSRLLNNDDVLDIVEPVKEYVNGKVKTATFSGTTNASGNLATNISSINKIPLFVKETLVNNAFGCYGFIASDSSDVFKFKFKDIGANTNVANTNVAGIIYYIEL